MTIVMVIAGYVAFRTNQKATNVSVDTEFERIQDSLKQFRVDIEALKNHRFDTKQRLSILEIEIGYIKKTGDETSADIKQLMSDFSKILGQVENFFKDQQ